MTRKKIFILVCIILSLSLSRSWARDTPPVLSITSEIPQETAQEAIIIEGAVSDDVGIMSVTFRVKHGLDTLFVKAATLEPIDQSEQQQRYTFVQSVPLKPGQNQIIIQAIDSDSQGDRVIKTVLRTGSKPTVRPTPQPQPSPTAHPVTPTPAPQKTQEEILGQAEVMVKDDQFHVIKTRESYEDLVRGESLPPFFEA